MSGQRLKKRHTTDFLLLSAARHISPVEFSVVEKLSPDRHRWLLAQGESDLVWDVGPERRQLAHLGIDLYKAVAEFFAAVGVENDAVGFDEFLPVLPFRYIGMQAHISSIRALDAGLFHVCPPESVFTER